MNSYDVGAAQLGRAGGGWEGGWFMPVGVETGWRVRGVNYVGLVACPIDLGAFAALCASGESADDGTELTQALSPGVAAVVSPIRDVPLSFGATLQWLTMTG